jgi:outer membrane protein
MRIQTLVAALVGYFWGVEMLAQTPSVAAPLLTPEAAVELALANNYDIWLIRADADIAHLNNTRGNAGLLPTVNLVASDNFTLSAFQQQLANGSSFEALGAPFNTLNAGVQLNQTLFDGRRMHTTKQRLDALDQLGQTQLVAQVQATVAAVLLTYADIVRGENQERALREAIVLTEERRRIAEARLAAGFAAQTDALAAQLDLHQRQADLLTQQTNTTLARHALNRLLVRDANLDFSVDGNALSTDIPDRAVLLERLSTSNASLLTLQKAAEVARITQDETNRLAAPRLVGIAQANVVRADNGAGFLRNNSQAGITVGLAFSMPIYSGGNQNRLEQVAAVSAQQAQLRVENQRKTLEIELDNLLTLADMQRRLLALETQNIDIARQNLLVSTERFRLGQTTGLEVQIAQNTLEQVQTRRLQAQFGLQGIATQLRLLAGDF